ncbi:hypothetical protein [Bacillus sp. AFS053548]|uniref:hypothetical protein n=1 Tax=Bacillus sp. AFS053548 TaxID=2033505 RepID=UPI000BFC8C4B|nr:hypothetical protein [Bacillus sp. AFS053548]PGM54927.1 hypothetical protein CN946_15140 [Bacillus sp. AFS053548]
MDTQNLYKKIIANVELFDILSDYFDFELVEPNLNTKDYFFRIDDPATVIAQDATGGVFALIGKAKTDYLPVIFISSEGQVGKVGNNFVEFFSIMISCPYWRDLLKFSGNGQFSEMKKAYPLLKDELLEDFPEIETVMRKVTSELSLNLITNPVEALYEAMTSQTNFIVYSLEGEEFESLFNSHIVTDNPLWKKKLQ